jgi:aryl-alcohol dehydrogenase-like predicted oxidoreductase
MGRAMHVAPISVVQHQWSALSHAEEADLAATWCSLHGGRFLAWSPLASGYLTDGFDVASLSPDDLRRRLPWSSVDLTPLQQAAREQGMSLEKYALSWAAQRAHPIVGARSPEEVALMADIEPLRDQS